MVFQLVISFIVGAVVGFLFACFIGSRQSDLEDDDLGYLEKIINNESEFELI